MEKYMPIRLLLLVLILIPVITYGQSITLNCKTEGGKDWGTLKIDLKQKTIIDINVSQKFVAQEYEDWLKKYQTERGKVYTPTPFDPDKSADTYKITKITDQIIFGEMNKWGYKDIEVNRYNLQMRYPSNNWTDSLNCTKVEKAF